MASVRKLTDPGASPVEAPSLHQELVDTVREMILSGQLKPGRAIAEVKLCNELGISRTPLREALKVLASENLVVLVQNRGAVVTEIAVDEIAEIFVVMAQLEELVGRLAAERMTPVEREEISTMHVLMKSLHRSGRRTEYFDLNQAIHLRLAELSGNRTLVATYFSFARKIRRARYLANLSDARWADSVREHDAFMAALEAGDRAGFVAMLRDHLVRTGDVVCAALRGATSRATLAGERA